MILFPALYIFMKIPHAVVISCAAMLIRRPFAERRKDCHCGTVLPLCFQCAFDFFFNFRQKRVLYFFHKFVNINVPVIRIIR